MRYGDPGNAREDIFFLVELATRADVEKAPGPVLPALAQ